MDIYYIEKAKQIHAELKPICDAFKITNWSYDITESLYNKAGVREELVIEGQRISCTSNSVSAVLDELIGYIFITRYCRNRSLGAFEKQVKNQIKTYWVKE